MIQVRTLCPCEFSDDPGNMKIINSQGTIFKNNTFIWNQREFRHEIMKSKALYIVLLLSLLLVPAVNAEDALDLYTRGQYALTTGDYASALTYFDNAIALQSNYAAALSAKSVTLNFLQRYADAVSTADQAIALRPSDQNALNARAYGLFNLGRYAEAVTAYDALFATQALRADAYCNQGYAYSMLNNSASALVSYDKCTALDPNNADSWNQKGLVLMDLGRYQEALDAYDEATQITVKNAGIWNNKGLALAALGRYPEALQCFNKALGLQPDFPDALKNKESVYGKLQVVNITGTITPTVTISRIGTPFTIVTPSQLPSQITSLPSTEPVPPATTPVAAKTTYAPVSPFTSLTALTVVCGFLIAGSGIKKIISFLQG